MVYILVLNWNNAKDTIDCLKSLLDMKTHNVYKIVLCDNASTDESLVNFIEFFKKNSIKYITYKECDVCNDNVERDADVILICNEKNKGFAGGNNVGLRYIVRVCNVNDYVWILNNDTVIPSYSMDYLCEYMDLNKDVGICGSTIIYEWGGRKIVQSYGGAHFNFFTGSSYSIGNRTIYKKENAKKIKSSMIDYITGASMFVRKTFLEDIGLICEDYFLYYEEIDWTIRMKNFGDKYCIGYCSDSIVYHKEGATTGGHTAINRSLISDYYGIRNKLIFTRKYKSKYLLFIYVSIVISALLRIKRRQWKHFYQIVRILINE